MAANIATQTPQGILSFPHVFTPKAPAVGSDPRFSCVLVYTPDVQSTPEYKALVAAVRHAAKEKWKDDMPSNLRSPIRDTSEKPKHYGNFPDGSKFISLWRKADAPPGVVDANVQPIHVPSDVFSGQIARCSFSAFAYSNSGNNGVALYMNNLQICKADMDRLDGRLPPEKEFDKVSDGSLPASAGTSQMPASDDDDLDDGDPFS